MVVVVYLVTSGEQDSIAATSSDEDVSPPASPAGKKRKERTKVLQASPASPARKRTRGYFDSDSDIGEQEPCADDTQVDVSTEVTSPMSNVPCAMVFTSPRSDYPSTASPACPMAQSASAGATQASYVSTEVSSPMSNSHCAVVFMSPLSDAPFASSGPPGTPPISHGTGSEASWTGTPPTQKWGGSLSPDTISPTQPAVCEVASSHIVREPIPVRVRSPSSTKVLLMEITMFRRRHWGPLLKDCLNAWRFVAQNERPMEVDEPGPTHVPDRSTPTGTAQLTHMAARLVVGAAEANSMSARLRASLASALHAPSAPMPPAVGEPSAAVSDMQVDARDPTASGSDARCVLCTFSRSDSPSLQQCHFPDCIYKNKEGGTWLHMAQHWRTKHGVKWKGLPKVSAFVAEEVRKLHNAQQNASNQRKKKVASDAPPTTPPKQSQQPQQSLHKKADGYANLKQYMRPGMTPALLGAATGESKPAAASSSKCEDGDVPFYLKDGAIDIRACYLEHPGVSSKSDGTTGRATWPFPKNVVALREFYDHLVDEMGKSASEADNCSKRMGKVLGCLECGERDPSDSLVLVAFLFGRLKDFMKMPLMNIKYAWTGKMLAAMQEYAEFHLAKIKKQLVLDQSNDELKTSRDAIEYSMGAMSHYTTKCGPAIVQRMNSKVREDTKALDELPTPAQMQAAVREAYMDAIVLVNDWGGDAGSTKRIQLNTILCGAIVLDTYAGRVHEWVIAARHVVQRMLDSDDYWIACQNHKTSQHYGDVGKYISPGLKEMFRLYSLSPRPSDCMTFMVPAKQGASTITTFNYYLKLFWRKYLPLNTRPVQVNLMRKFFHSAFIEATRTENEVKKLMVIIDKHSTAVQDKFYILKNPKSDAKLAKELLSIVFPGGTVKWPSEAEVDANMTAICNRLYPKEPAAEFDDTLDIADEDEDLASWVWGHFFGVRQAMTAIADGGIHGSGAASSCDAMVLYEPSAAAPAPNNVEGGNAHFHARLQQDSEARTAAHCRTPPVSARLPCPASGPKEPKIRRPVSKEAHDWMVGKLKEWQELHGCGGGGATKAKYCCMIFRTVMFFFAITLVHELVTKSCTSIVSKIIALEVDRFCCVSPSIHLDNTFPAFRFRKSCNRSCNWQHLPRTRCRREQKKTK